MNIRRIKDSDYNRIHNILEQHLTKEDVKRNIESVQKQNTFVYLQNKNILGFLSYTINEKNEPLDNNVFNGYGIIPLEKYSVIQSGYVDSNRTGEGIGRKLAKYIIDKCINKDINLFYTETWIKPERKDSSNLLDKYTSASKVRESEDHFSEWKENASSKELQRVCPGCFNHNKNCKCRGAIYCLQLDKEDKIFFDC
jgi:L-amino acid N-acyltransferase YncA